jgi:hypothetical protein
MQTTLETPDDVFRRAKAAAAEVALLVIVLGEW